MGDSEAGRFEGLRIHSVLPTLFLHFNHSSTCPHSIQDGGPLVYQSLFLTGVKGEAPVSGTKFSRFSETDLQGSPPAEGLRLDTGICHVSGSKQFKGKGGMRLR